MMQRGLRDIAQTARPLARGAGEGFVRVVRRAAAFARARLLPGLRRVCAGMGWTKRLVVLASALAVLVFLLGINRNLFTLAFSLALLIVASMVVTRRGAKIVIFMLYLASITLSVRSPLPEQVNVHAGLTKGSIRLEPNTVREYVFHLKDLQRHLDDCGPMSGALFVVGYDLKTVEIRINHRPIEADSITPVYERDLLKEPLPAEFEVPLRVGLTPEPGSEAMLYQGPEVHGTTAYPDAVYILYKNKRCRVIYHAAPEVRAL